MQKFRSIADVPRVPRATKLDQAALRRIEGLWSFGSLASGRIYPRGVFKYRSLEDAQTARQELTTQNIRRLREERKRTG